MKASELEQKNRNKKRMIKIDTGTTNNIVVLTSYQASLLIAKSGKPHTIAEE